MNSTTLPLVLKKQPEKKQEADQRNLTKCSFPKQETACKDIVVFAYKSCD